MAVLSNPPKSSLINKEVTKFLGGRMGYIMDNDINCRGLSDFGAHIHGQSQQSLGYHGYLLNVGHNSLDIQHGWCSAAAQHS